MKIRPIGIFDSGVGGLTVAAALINQLPGENFIYYGDTAHVPYGNKSRAELFKYAEDIINFLLEHDVKTIVAACGTHSSVTVPKMTAACPVPLLGVVKSGARAAVSSSRNGKIGVIATQATVNSRSYDVAINALEPAYEVFTAACAKFVPLIEAGQLNGTEARQAVSEYIGPLLKDEIDTLVMGCTHYPFLAPLIGEFTGAGVTLVDPAVGAVDELSLVHNRQNLLNAKQVKGSGEFYVSGDTDAFYKVGRLLLGDVLEKVEKARCGGGLYDQTK